MSTSITRTRNVWNTKDLKMQTQKMSCFSKNHSSCRLCCAVSRWDFLFPVLDQSFQADPKTPGIEHSFVNNQKILPSRDTSARVVDDLASWTTKLIHISKHHLNLSRTYIGAALIWSAGCDIKCPHVSFSLYMQLVISVHAPFISKLKTIWIHFLDAAGSWNWSPR